jgi:hypothetical protein
MVEGGITMANMGYCRFENTLGDLRDCYEHLDDDVEELNEYEKRARKALIALCQEIAANTDEDDVEA